MKNQFFLLLFGSFAAVSSVSHAALFSADFSGLAGNDPLVPNVGGAYGGWTQSELNSEDVDGEYPLAYGHSIETAPGVFSDGVAVGAFNAIPTADTFHIDHAFGGGLVGTTISLSFALDDPEAGMGYPQNTFEIGAYSTSSGNLFSFVAGATIDPTIWNMYYRIGSGSNQLISADYALTSGGIASMTLSFTGSGADALFNLEVLGGLVPVTASSTMTGMATENFDDFRVSMLKVPGTTAGDLDSYGTNFIAIADLQIIPEPGSAALLGLAAGVLMLRRRRA
jgi:hypothetical protein